MRLDVKELVIFYPYAIICQMLSINKEEFFREIAANSGIDSKVAELVYYGMIRTISRQLKARQSIVLPDWGEFYLIIQKSKKNMAVVGEGARQPDVLPPILMVKFSPDRKVKKYFQEFGKEA